MRDVIFRTGGKEINKNISLFLQGDSYGKRLSEMEIQIFGFQSWNPELAQRSTEGSTTVSPNMVFVNQLFQEMHEKVIIHTHIYMFMGVCIYDL